MKSILRWYQKILQIILRYVILNINNLQLFFILSYIKKRLL